MEQWGPMVDPKVLKSCVCKYTGKINLENDAAFQKCVLRLYPR